MLTKFIQIGLFRSFCNISGCNTGLTHFAYGSNASTSFPPRILIFGQLLFLFSAKMDFSRSSWIPFSLISVQQLLSFLRWKEECLSKHVAFPTLLHSLPYSKFPSGLSQSFQYRPFPSLPPCVIFPDFTNSVSTFSLLLPHSILPPPFSASFSNFPILPSYLSLDFARNFSIRAVLIIINITFLQTLYQRSGIAYDVVMRGL